MNALTRRLQFWKAIRGHWSFKVAAVVWSAFWLLTGVRDNFLQPTTQQKYATLKILPRWHWYVWVIGLLVLLLAMIFEGAFHASNRAAIPSHVEPTPPPRLECVAEIHRNVASVDNPGAPSAPETATALQDRSPPPKSGLITLGVRLVHIDHVRSYSEGEIIRETRNSIGPRGIIACFRNEPSVSREVADATHVRAHLIYKNNEGQEIGNGIASACWLEHYPDSINFALGESHCVLLGLLTQDRRLKVAEKTRHRDVMGSSYSIQYEVLDGVVGIEVKLIGGKNELMVDPLRLNLSFTGGEPQISVSE